MATRNNTVVFAFDTLTSALSAATRHDFAAITVQVDETSSRTFRSVYLEVTCRGNETSATSMTSRLFGIKIDAVAFNDSSVTETIPNTGDQQTFRFRRDVTSYFNTNFTGASHSVQAAVQFGTLAVINVSAKLVVTYEYDDAAATTRTKTAWIPLDSAAGTQTTTLTEIGTNQVPQLTGVGGMLPESSVTIRDMFFIIMANEGHESGNTDEQFAVSLDAEAEVQFGVLEQALDSSPWMEVVWKRTDMNPASAHAFKARSVATTNRFPQLCALLVVTYSYDHDASSSILNSIMVPMPTEAGAFGGTTSALQSKVAMTVPIEEPGTITLKQSGVLASYHVHNVALAGLNIAVGSQSHRAYTPSTLYFAPAGQQTVMQRFDSGGAAGSGITLARGENEITLAWYRTSTTSGAVGSGWSALLILNYVSDKASAGAGAHNHTTLWLAGGFDAVSTTLIHDYAFAPNVPESSYWVTCAGYEVDFLQSGRGALVLAAERLSGDGVADGWEQLMHIGVRAAPENSVYTMFANASRSFDRHPADPDGNRLALESSRTYRITSFPDNTTSHGGWSSFVMMLTYHALTTPMGGALSDYASEGDGSGAVIRVHRADNDELVYETTSAVGGGYSFTFYSNTLELYAHTEYGAKSARTLPFTPA